MLRQLSLLSICGFILAVAMAQEKSPDCAKLACDCNHWPIRAECRTCCKVNTGVVVEVGGAGITIQERNGKRTVHPVRAGRTSGTIRPGVAVDVFRNGGIAVAAPRDPIAMADEMSDFLDEASLIQQGFIQTNDVDAITARRQSWADRVQAYLEQNLGHSYAITFKNASGSAWMGCPVGRSVAGCVYWQELEGKKKKLDEIVTEVRTQKAAGGAVEQHNTGGINVQQATTGQNSAIVNSPIVIGDVPRRISPEDANVLKTFLAGAKTKARLKISADANTNLRQFSDDFYAVFKESGWRMEDPGVDTFLGFGPPGKRFAGVVVVVKGQPLQQGEEVTLGSDNALFYVAKVVDALKIPHILRREPNQPEDLISISFEGRLE